MLDTQTTDIKNYRYHKLQISQRQHIASSELFIRLKKAKKSNKILSKTKKQKNKQTNKQKKQNKTRRSFYQNRVSDLKTNFVKLYNVINRSCFIAINVKFHVKYARDYSNA